MSGTRLPFQKAQAIEALIVAHGQPSDPGPAEQALREIADKVAAMLPGWHVQSATMAAPGELERVLEQATDTPFVYPLFMSDGWFTETALPARLGIARDRVLSPFGLSARLPVLATQSLSSIARDQGWQHQSTEILVAAHGSASGRENPASRTYRFAHALSLLAPWQRVRVGFLEQDPLLSAVAANCGHNTICVPFFAADGYHVACDIPNDLRAGGFSGVISKSVGRADYAPTLIAEALQGAILENAA
ncbi:sirohydrochlorin ferrochelatase [Aliiruegeria haliotis]|uniref:Sirohydrochlorin ferrochelatase n=1 Tax=Aliiruegeria haliotis TaxID=1280846 RepID=A0A2T0RL03_9RHOB|nr:CbiX/SirB N-terminal domain-containing protein [Aliiruegeria haliotis]PRY21876.1 sirohydrochlorin ferrochelatase [Aliiruegeria haliotis]